MAKILKDSLGLAGEYRVCSELNKRDIFATITYGNCKSIDIYAIRNRKSLRIEVKTSQNSDFVVNPSPNGKDTRDFWVLVQIQRDGDEDTFHERFFVLAHKELCRIQSTRAKGYADRYEMKHGEKWDSSKGVNKVSIIEVAAFENKWQKIDRALGKAD